MNEIGIWKHKLTGEVYEIKQSSSKSKELVFAFISGNVVKDKTPFALNTNWNRFGYFEKITE